MYIAEQQLIAAAVGMQAVGWRPFASTFAAFLSRAYDFVRMAAVSRATFSVSGSHAGVSIGEDGPSQMALEDIAEFRAIHGSTVLHPCDGNQTARLVAAMADNGRNLVSPDAPARHAGHLLPRRGVRDRRFPRPPLERKRRGRAHRRGDHRARGAESRRHARRGKESPPASSTSTRSSHSTKIRSGPRPKRRGAVS